MGREKASDVRELKYGDVGGRVVDFQRKLNYFLMDNSVDNPMDSLWITIY